LGAIAAAIAAGIVIGRARPADDPDAVLGWGLASFSFGMLVGLSEILTRYRDEPITAATTAYGAFYLVLNGSISLAAYALLLRYPNQIFPVAGGDLFLAAVLAGFGAMTVLRSSLFTYRSPDGTEYKIGPAIAIETIFKTIDQKIDRQRARERHERVFRSLNGIREADFQPVADYVEMSLLSFQTLTQQQKAEITDFIQQLKSTTWSGWLKTLALGFVFLTVAGEENFDEMVENLKKKLSQ
jgi:hypothetical protein